MLPDTFQRNLEQNCTQAEASQGSDWTVRCIDVKHCSHGLKAKFTMFKITDTFFRRGQP